MEKDKPSNSDDERWTRPFQSAKDATKLLGFLPWKERACKIDKDPRQFRFAIVCNHCNIHMNSLGSMRKHLNICPERKMPDLTCGHCAKSFRRWCKLTEHLNAPGMEVQKACKPYFKLSKVFFPSFETLPKCVRKTALRVAGKGTKVPKSQIRYNSWRNVHSTDMKALRCEAIKIREKNFRVPVVVSPVRESTENSSEGTVSRHGSVVSFSDVEPDDTSVPFCRTLLRSSHVAHPWPRRIL